MQLWAEWESKCLSYKSLIDPSRVDQVYRGWEKNLLLEVHCQSNAKPQMFTERFVSINLNCNN